MKGDNAQREPQGYFLNVEELGLHTLLLGMENGTTTLENNFTVFKKVKHMLAI